MCYKVDSITRLVAAFLVSLSVSGVSLDRIEVYFINDTETASGPNPCSCAVWPRGRFRVYFKVIDLAHGAGRGRNSQSEYQSG